MFVAIVGLAYLGLPVSRLRKLLGFVMGMAGIVVIFLSHVRSSLVVVVGCAVIYSIIMVGAGTLEDRLDAGVSGWRSAAFAHYSMRNRMAGKAPSTDSPRCWRTIP